MAGLVLCGGAAGAAVRRRGGCGRPTRSSPHRREAPTSRSAATWPSSSPRRRRSNWTRCHRPARRRTFTGFATSPASSSRWCSPTSTRHSSTRATPATAMPHDHQAAARGHAAVQRRAVLHRARRFAAELRARDRRQQDQRRPAAQRHGDVGHHAVPHDVRAAAPERSLSFLSNEDALVKLTGDKSIDVAVVVAGQPAKLLADMKPEARALIKLLKFDAEHPPSKAALKTYFPTPVCALRTIRIC